MCVLACVCVTFSHYIWLTFEGSCGEGVRTVTEVTDATVKPTVQYDSTAGGTSSSYMIWVQALSQQASAMLEVPLSKELNQTLSPLPDGEKRKKIFTPVKPHSHGGWHADAEHELQGIGSDLNSVSRERKTGMMNIQKLSLISVISHLRPCCLPCVKRRALVRSGNRMWAGELGICHMPWSLWR